MHKREPKFIIVTGGVLSGLGKGIAAASIGHLLSSKLKVIPMKLDGYLNTDPGTMNPIEHGEVFVLDDGGEVDMDFGHYERFLGVTSKVKWNLTMGKVYQEVREKERRGDYLGKTVQNIPHVVNLIKSKFFEVAEEEDADIMLIEVGGTVGDMENDLYIEAVRQLKAEVGEGRIVFIHLSYVPIPTGVNEQKSKPTQQSVMLLQQRGIMPDIIIGRCEEMLEDKIREKIALFCNVEKEAVISGIDVDSVYKLPLVFEKEGLVEILHRKLGIYSPPDMQPWKQLLDKLANPTKELTIAICGKYTKLEDSYASIVEALQQCAAHEACKVRLKWIETTNITNDLEAGSALRDVDGMIVPGGFGERGVEGKINLIRYAREHDLPFLGICLGLQLAVVEFTRNRCGLKEANSTEVDASTPHPVVTILPSQQNITQKGVTMRLGAYPAVMQEGTRIFDLYGKKKEVSERHRHRYEVNPKYHETLIRGGLVFSGISLDKRLVEFLEIPEHKYFVATQSHPELKSRLLEPAPLFMGLIKAALTK